MEVGIRMIVDNWPAGTSILLRAGVSFRYNQVYRLCAHSRAIRVSSRKRSKKYS